MATSTRSLFKPSEQEIHEDLVTFLRLAGIEHFHVPNGEKRSKWVGAKLKRMGVSRGVPDLIIAPAGPGRPVAALELKAPGEKPSPEQKAWLASMASTWGMLAGWADSLEKALAILRSWGYRL